MGSSVQRNGRQITLTPVALGGNHCVSQRQPTRGESPKISGVEPAHFPLRPSEGGDEDQGACPLAFAKPHHCKLPSVRRPCRPKVIAIAISRDLQRLAGVELLDVHVRGSKIRTAPGECHQFAIRREGGTLLRSRIPGQRRRIERRDIGLFGPAGDRRGQGDCQDRRHHPRHP